MVEVKDFLQKGRRLNFEIDELIRARDIAFNLACGTAAAPDGEKVQTTKVNTSEIKFVKYAEYSAEIDKRIRELYEYRQCMLRLINKLDSTVYRSVLIARYINCKTWEQVADTIGLKDVRHIYRLHEKALLCLQSCI